MHQRSFAFVGAVCLAATFAACTRAATPSDSTTLRSRLVQIMEQETKEGFSGVVLVAHGDEILLHQGYGLADRKTRTPMTKDTVIDAGSFSKQVTAAAAVLLESQGKLSLGDTLGKYFETIPADKRHITIKQLLSHTAGIYPWAMPDDFTPIPREAWLDKVFRAPLQHPPGQQYLYSNDGYTLVAMIIEKATGKPYRDYIKATFFVPLGMTHSGWYDDAIFRDPAVSVATGYNNGKDDGAPNEWPGPYWALLGNGGILWTAADMLKWHKAVHGDLLPKAAKQKLFTPVAQVGERPGYDGEQLRSHYALGWNIGRTTCGDLRIGHTGAGISHNVDYRYYKDRDLLVYVASNKLDANSSGEELFYSKRAANSIAREVLKDCPQPAPSS
jgi:CubicO group peptidase (beta-lactamase class C family)